MRNVRWNPLFYNSAINFCPLYSLSLTCYCMLVPITRNFIIWTMCIICTGSHLSEKLQTSLKKEWCLHFFNCSSLLWLLLQSLLNLLSIRSSLTSVCYFFRHLFSVFIQLDLSLGFNIINCFNPSWNSSFSLWSTIFLMVLLLLQLLFSNLMILYLVL